MARYAVGPYNERDLPGILALLVAAKNAGTVDLELRSSVLRVVLRDPRFDAQRLTLLVRDERGLVGFGILWRGRYLGFVVHPRTRGVIERAILDWASSAVAEARSAGSDAPLWALCRSDDTTTRAILEAAGYTLADEELRMTRNLRDPIMEAPTPPGFTIRALRGADELPAWIALYEETFGRGSATVARREATMRDGDYLAELDLVAVDASGAMAAMCTCSVAGYEAAHCRAREGKLGPIAVDARFRRRGLGRAIVTCGMRLLRGRGLDHAVLDTDIGNHSAHGFYASLGFRADYTACWYAAPGSG